MANHYRKILNILLPVVALTFTSVSHTAFAVSSQDYTPLAPIALGDNKFHTDLILYLNDIFKFSIAGCVVLAIFMIILGGIQYMSTDAMSSKSDGKKRIQNAIFGLVLAMVCILILYTVNPDLTNLSVLNLSTTTLTNTTKSSVWCFPKVVNDQSIGTKGAPAGAKCALSAPACREKIHEMQTTPDKYIIGVFEVIKGAKKFYDYDKRPNTLEQCSTAVKTWEAIVTTMTYTTSGIVPGDGEYNGCSNPIYNPGGTTLQYLNHYRIAVFNIQDGKKTFDQYDDLAKSPGECDGKVKFWNKQKTKVTITTVGDSTAAPNSKGETADGEFKGCSNAVELYAPGGECAEVKQP